MEYQKTYVSPFKNQPSKDLEPLDQRRVAVFRIWFRYGLSTTVIVS